MKYEKILINLNHSDKYSYHTFNHAIIQLSNPFPYKILFINSIIEKSYIKSFIKVGDVSGTIVFRNCYIKDCTFTDLHVSRIKFSYCILENCTFKKVKTDQLILDTCKINNVVTQSTSNIDVVYLTTALARSIIIGLTKYDIATFGWDYKEEYNNDKIQCKVYDYCVCSHELIHNLDLRKNNFKRNNDRIWFEYYIDPGKLLDPNNKCIIIDPLREIPKDELIGYKLVRRYFDDINKRDPDYYLAKLKIPKDARRSCAIGLKFRCDKAMVIGIYPIIFPVAIYDINGCVKPLEESDRLRYYINDLNDNEIDKNIVDYEFCSPFANNSNTIGAKDFKYKYHEELIEENFDDNRWNECSKGIHFFLSIEDLYEEYGVLIKDQH